MVYVRFLGIFISIFLIACLSFCQNLPIDSSIIPQDPLVRIGKLENGLTYYIRKNQHPKDKAELRLVVNVGCNAEDDDQQGFAHFIEHLCFDGTKHFPKQAIVDYIEHNGGKFGADLNAFTGSDETLFLLQLPSTNKQQLKTGLLMLKDWASSITFDTNEVKKESNIVMEEWRFRQNVDARINRQIIPKLLKNSRYNERSPIGKLENIQHYDYNRLIDFYKDWYRPNLMAIVIVGDFDADVVEQEIKNQFSDIQDFSSSRSLTSWYVPEQDSGAIAIIAHDKELIDQTIELIYKQKDQFKPRLVSDYPKWLSIRLITYLLNRRLSEFMLEAAAPIVWANAKYKLLTRNVDAFEVSVHFKESNYAPALTSLTGEIQRILKFGFTMDEFEHAKKVIGNELKSKAKEWNHTDSKVLASLYVSNFLRGTSMEGDSIRYGIVRKIFDTLQLQELTKVANELMGKDENLTIIVKANKNEFQVLPSEQEILDIYRKATLVQLDCYNPRTSRDVLLPDKPLSGTIVNESVNKHANTIMWKLSNGASVIVKPTEYKNNEILFFARSLGGTLSYDEKDVMSALLSAPIVYLSGIGTFKPQELDIILFEKRISLQPRITYLTDEFTGSCPPDELETFFQLLNLYYTNPRIDSIAFANYINYNKNYVKKQQSNPEWVFDDTITKVLSPRHQLCYDSCYDAITLNRVKEIYTERFKSAENFTFYFVGNVDTTILKPLVLNYLSSIPKTTGNHKKWKDIKLDPVHKHIEKTVKLGTENKSKVHLRIFGKMKFNRYNFWSLNFLKHLLQLRLFYTLRRELAEVYKFDVYATLFRYPKQGFKVVIEFTCKPENTDKLVESIFQQFRKIRSEGCTVEELSKVKEIIKRENEIANNKQWLDVLSEYDYNGFDLNKIDEQNSFYQDLTVRQIKRVSHKYLFGKHVATFKLHPNN